MICPECLEKSRDCECGQPHPPLDPVVPQGTEAAVCKDISDRQLHGIKKYGVTVAKNPLSLRQWLQHAYEETLDKAVYLKRAIEEIDAKNAQSLAEASQQ